VRYFDEAREIWSQHVPPRGQADTVQGELLRGIEKLRREAQTNGNINWSDQFENFATWIETTLSDSGVFDAAAVAEIHADIVRVRNFEYPATDDAPYDRLADRTVEWSQAKMGRSPGNPIQGAPSDTTCDLDSGCIRAHPRRWPLPRPARDTISPCGGSAKAQLFGGCASTCSLQTEVLTAP
jgi:hypothetical protein